MPLPLRYPGKWHHHNHFKALRNSKHCSLLPSSWRPSHLTPAENMHMKMVDTLRTMFAIIYDDTESIGTFLLPHALCNVQQMSQDIFLVLARIAQLRKPIAIFWND